MKITALDTGGYTGIALWRDGDFQAFDLPAGEAMTWLAHHLVDDPPDELVCERLEIRKDSHKRSQEILMAVEQVGVARYLAFCHGIAFRTQKPVEAKRFSTDEKLRAMDMWVKGPRDHQRDATRHLLLRVSEVDAAFRQELARRV